MNKRELIDSIDATYLKVDFSENKRNEIIDKLIKYEFKYFCTWPNLHYDWGYFYASEQLGVTLDYKSIGVFNFPAGLREAWELHKNVQQYRHNIDGFDIVVPHNLSPGNEPDDFIKFMGNLTSNCGYKPIKLIVEHYLEPNKRHRLVEICNEAINVSGVHYIKTHTGFGSRGVEVDDVKRIKDIVGDKIRIKASGGIKTLDQLMELKEAGASRFGIGIDSAINIIKELG